jgi:hypothetical protein
MRLFLQCSKGTVAWNKHYGWRLFCLTRQLKLRLENKPNFSLKHVYKIKKKQGQEILLQGNFNLEVQQIVLDLHKLHLCTKFLWV